MSTDVIREPGGNLVVHLGAAGRKLELDLAPTSADLVPGLGLTTEEVSDVPEVLELETARFVLSLSSGTREDGWEYELRVGRAPVVAVSPESPGEHRWTWTSPTTLATEHVQPFVNAAGVSVLEVIARRGGSADPLVLGRLPLKICSSKLTPGELEALLLELEEVSSGLLYDAFARTFLATRHTHRPARRMPVESLERIRAACNQFARALARISRQPAQRLTLSPRRVGIAPGEPITPETVASLAEDVSLLGATSQGPYPRERIEMRAERDVQLPEHLALASFLTALEEETHELLKLLGEEVERRQQLRKAFAASTTGIWAQREEPRIRQAAELIAVGRRLLSQLKELRRSHDFLPLAAPPLRRPPELTKRFAQVSTYSALYRVMVEHLGSHAREFEDWGAIVGVRSLPELWEYWVVLKTVEHLQRRLRHDGALWSSKGSLFRRLTGTRDRFAPELWPRRWLDFTDASGRRVVLRYIPRYRCLDAAGGARRDDGVCRLRRVGRPYEPDLALEIHAPESPADAAPESLMILDAKYSVSSAEEILERISKYRNLGDPTNGRRLVRHVWAITCGTPPVSRAGGPLRLEDCAVVDNECFFDPSFSGPGETCGVLSVRPGDVTTSNSMTLLLDRLLGLLGVSLEGPSPALERI